MEYLVVLAAFSWMVGVCFFFEVIGAWQSGDEQVQIEKAIQVAPEPLMMIMGLIFAHMIRVCEKKLAESPMYKQRIAALKAKGEGGGGIFAGNIKKRPSVDSDDLDDPANNNGSVTSPNNNLTSQPHSLRNGGKCEEIS